MHMKKMGSYQDKTRRSKVKPDFISGLDRTGNLKMNTVSQPSSNPNLKELDQTKE